MALAQVLRSMPVGALLVRFPKELDAALGKPPRTSKERLGTCGVEVGPANGEREWLAGVGRIRVVPTLVMVGRRRGSTRNDANGEAVGDRPLALLRMVTLNVPAVPIIDGGQMLFLLVVSSACAFRQTSDFTSNSEFVRNTARSRSATASPHSRPKSRACPRRSTPAC